MERVLDYFSKYIDNLKNTVNIKNKIILTGIIMRKLKIVNPTKCRDFSHTFNSNTTEYYDLDNKKYNFYLNEYILQDVDESLLTLQELYVLAEETSKLIQSTDLL